MEERLRESLSALMDDEANELEVERVLSRIDKGDEARQTWVRYQAARSALRGEPVPNLSWDISSSVREALENEASPVGKVSVVQRMLRPVASFAVAASVAATVVLGGQQLSQVAGADAERQTIAAGPSPVGIVNVLGATPVQASYGTQVPVLKPAAHTAYRELAKQKLQKFQQEHAEHASLNSPQGLIPFARVVRIAE